ncbi:unnamed protein product [Trypanosoma congolense IL3000]|uniref:Putative nucleosome assembly protein n=1 Tax=Trypanosoma congolense (strain IL3000) TaxID=1068625 RepID=F9WFE7_TRYCI|nr:putative nucleosome assembly protein [Trypanosoma congolense IL3000]CCD16015.1 unnamed protein product [Trypanosoma congolense IL3000]
MPAKRKAAQHRDDDDDDASEEDNSAMYQKYFNKNFSREFMSKLPKRINERVQVLLHYHEECEKIRKSFEEKETALRRKYDELYAPLLDKRMEIITGKHLPTDEEVMEGMPSDHQGVVDITCTDDTEKGLPGFWLRVLKHHVLPKFVIKEHDEPVLMHLMDVRSGVVDGGYGSFAVAFIFEPNEFFEETTLILKLIQGEDGVNIDRTPITWKPGKDVTVKKKRKKTGKRGQAGKSAMVTVPRASFFNAFKESGWEIDADDDDDDDDELDGGDDEWIEQFLQVLHTSIIPSAVHHYTGEAPDGSSDIDSDCDDEEDEESDDDDDCVLPVKGSNQRGGVAGKAGGKSSPECKQQ